MNWEKLFRKYIWDDQTTPYLVTYDKLNRRQANSEILVYSLFQGIFFAIVVVASLRGGPDGRALGAALYGFSVVCAAALFGLLKIQPAALYLSATPLVALAYIFLYGLSSERATIDTVFVSIVLLLLLRYSLRIVAIAHVYPDLPEPSDDYTPRRRR